MLAAALLSISVPVCAGALTRSELAVALSPDLGITVELYWPVNRAPRALVVVVPGSGGLSDPYFDPEMQRPTYDSDHRGGLTALLTAKGYAVAFYSLRGYAVLRNCVSGDNFAARAAAFVARCIDTTVRAGAGLDTTTADTAAIFAALAHAPRTTGLTTIALAYSEGMHHVGLLAGQRRIAPAAIVGVGGPHVALADVWAYQMRRDYYHALTRRALARCPGPALTLTYIPACAQTEPTSDLLTHLSEFLAADSVDAARLAARRQQVLQLYQNVLTHYADAPPGEIMPGAFAGVPIAAAWNARYYSQVFKTRISGVDQLRGYSGRSVFLFGVLDHMVPPRRALGCGSVGNCTMSQVDGVGHGLEDASGFPPPHALGAIAEAIDRAGQLSNR